MADYKQFLLEVKDPTILVQGPMGAVRVCSLRLIKLSVAQEVLTRNPQVGRHNHITIIRQIGQIVLFPYERTIEEVVAIVY